MKFKALTINNITILLIFCTLIFTFYQNQIFNFQIDFNSIYSEIDKLSYETPKKVNTEVDNISFYIPTGYQVVNDKGIFLESVYSDLNIIPDKLEMTKINENYEINPTEKVVFEKLSSNQTNNEKFTNMIVWDIDNDMYEILIINDENNAVVGDIKEKYIYQGITDMAYILNSIKKN